MSDLLQLVVSEGASDLHVRVGTPPTIRVHGIRVGSGSDHEVCSAEEPRIQGMPRRARVGRGYHGAGDERARAADAGERQDPQAHGLPGVDDIGTEGADELPQASKQSKIEQARPTECTHVDAVPAERVGLGAAVAQLCDADVEARTRESGGEQPKLLAGAAVLQGWDDQKDVTHGLPARRYGGEFLRPAGYGCALAISARARNGKPGG